MDVCPWVNCNELKDVYEDLYSPNFIIRRHAAARVEMWQARCNSCLPPFIQCSVALVRSTIQDEINQQNGFLCSSADIQLMYASSIIRFVNLVSSVSQPRIKSIPTRKAAREWGIPDWIIHLRNDATHNKMPNVNRLREAAHFALIWLNENFWKKYVESFVDVQQPQNMLHIDAAETIANFESLRFKMLYMDGQNSSSFNEVTMMKALHKDIERLIMEESKKFFDTLLAPGVFLHFVEQLEHLLSKEEKDSFVETTITLPIALQVYWFPVINVIEKCCKLQEFVESLFSCLNRFDSLQQKLAAVWAYKLVNFGLPMEMRSEDEPDSPIDKLFSSKALRFNWVALVVACAKCPCIYTPALLPKIVSQIYPLISERKMEHLMALVSLAMGATVGSNASKPKKIYTIKDMDLALETSKPSRSLFQEVPPEQNIDWSRIPLGHVFGNKPAFLKTVWEPLPICEDEEQTLAKQENGEIANDIQIKNEECTTDDMIIPEGPAEKKSCWTTESAISIYKGEVLKRK